MALQVWMPFIKDAHNQGLQNTEVTAGTCTYTAGGVLGNAATFNGSSNYQRFDLTYGKQMTFACFAKFNAFNVHLMDCRNSSGVGYQPMYVQSTGLQAGANNGYVTISYNFTAGIWYHICVVETGTKCQLYINGDFVGEAAHTGIEGTAPLTIGCRYSTNQGWVNGQVNDVRIYNHALSIKEIKETSRGLVLHYKLDETYGMTNLIPNGNFAVYNNHGTGMTYTVTDIGETYMGQPVRRWEYTPQTDSVANSFRTTYGSHGVSTYTQFYFGESGTTIPFVYWVYYRPHTSGLTAGGVASNIGQWTEIPREYVGDGWYRVGQYRTGNNHATRTNDGIYTSIKWLYAAAGSSCTIDFTDRGYLLSGTTVIPENFVNGNSTVHDCSGYGNDGTIGGKPVPYGTTPRYSSSNTFAGSSYIRAGRTAMIKDEFTVAWWGYMASWGSYGRAASCTESGGWNFEPRSSKMSFIAHTGSYAYADDSITLANIPAGWHHFAGVFNGPAKRVLLYRDGTFVGSATTANSAMTYNSSNGIFFAAEAVSNQTTPTTPYFNNPMSDIRIYGRALSGDDIAELYHTPASVDNKGNLHCYELKET